MDVEMVVFRSTAVPLASTLRRDMEGTGSVSGSTLHMMVNVAFVVAVVKFVLSAGKAAGPGVEEHKLNMGWRYNGGRG